jgi:hypothetical protein
MSPAPAPLAELPCDEPKEHHPQLGRRVHAFTGRPPVRKASRSLLLLGVISVLMVPIGLKFVDGVTGTVIAVAGSVVAVLCYLLSGSRAQAPGIQIELFERGLACTQGKASRALMWNEITDVRTRTIPLAKGRQSKAIIFEVVAEEPLLIVVGAPFSDEVRTRELVEHLQHAWLAVWTRRARTLLQAEQNLLVGLANVSADGAELAGRTLAWEDIRGVTEQSGSPELETKEGPVPVEAPGQNVPFPSTAHRLAAIAQAGPVRRFLPLG